MSGVSKRREKRDQLIKQGVGTVRFCKRAWFGLGKLGHNHLMLGGTSWFNQVWTPVLPCFILSG